MEKKKTNRVRMYLMLSGLSILLTGCTQINENEENVSQLETEENISLEQERFFHDEPHSYRYTREGELLYEMQNSFRAEEYLEQEIQELDDYEYYINKESEGQAFLIVESDPDLMELYGEDKKLLGYYYRIYVGEEWEDHRVNWDWFYVREDLEEILWCEIVDGTLYSMEDWRESLQYKRRCDMIMDLRNQETELASLSLSEETHSKDTKWQDELEVTNCEFEKETGRISHQETEDGNVVILYDKQDHVIDTIDVIEKTGIHQLTDNLFEIVQSVGSPARFVFYYDAQTCKISDVFFNPILIENQYIAYIENGELIIRDIFDEGTFCKKITRDFTETADPTSAIISITLEKEGQFVIEYYQGEDYKMETEIISE